MANGIPLVVGFTKSDEIRVDTLLQKLIPHLKKDQFAIVGGLAIRHHLICAGIKYPKRPLNDLDIIAKKGGALLFVEVKTSSHASVLPEENITFRKLKCLLKTIEIYLMDNGVDYIWQLDSIAVLIDKETRKAQIRHLKNINIR